MWHVPKLLEHRTQFSPHIKTSSRTHWEADVLYEYPWIHTALRQGWEEGEEALSFSPMSVLHSLWALSKQLPYLAGVSPFTPENKLHKDTERLAVKVTMFLELS